MSGVKRRGSGFAAMVIAISLMLSMLSSITVWAAGTPAPADRIIARFLELDTVSVPAGVTAGEVISGYLPDRVGALLVAENEEDGEPAPVISEASAPDNSDPASPSGVEDSAPESVAEEVASESHGEPLGARVAFSAQELDVDAEIPVEVSVGWTAEGYDENTPGEYIFTAVLSEDGYLLAEGVAMPAVTVTVQQPTEQEPAEMTPLALGASFSVLRVYTGAGYASSPGTATLVSDLLDTSSPLYNAALEPDVIYFLYAEFTKSADVDAMRVRFGDESSQTTNGLVMVTPLDGAFAVGGIGNSFFDRLVSYTNYPDPEYGYSSESNVALDIKRATHALKDGAMVYGIKDTISNGAGIAFDYGFKIDDALYTNSVINDAFSFQLGRLDDSTQFQAVPGYGEESVDLTVAPKSPLRSWFGSTSLTGTVGGKTASATLYFLGNAAAPAKQTAALFDKVEIRVQVPQEIDVANYGLTATWQKYHTSYGAVSVSAGPPSGGSRVITFTIENGFKATGNGLPLFLEYSIAPSFTGASFTAQILDGTVTVMGQSLPITMAGSDTVTYQMLNAEEDKTQFTAPSDVNRPMYNTTLALGEGVPYSAYMGSVYVRNINADNPTPYEKTYEASYNITGAAANINVITIPCDRTALPTSITVSARNASGAAVVIDLTPAQISALQTIYNATAKTSGLRILLSDVEDGSGLVSFTGVVADIGKLPKGYSSSNWPAGTTFDRCAAGTYGYFTTTDIGTVVTHSYRLYNTNPVFRNETNGFLTATSSVTSTSANRSAFEAMKTTLNGVSTSSSKGCTVTAGKNVTVGGMARVYNVVFTCYTDLAERGTTNIVVDPVFYLTLPPGIGFDESQLRFALRRYDIRNEVDTGFTEALSHTITNVSYLNTTGDGVSIYKISFPKGLMIGQYSEDGFQYVVQYSIPLTTSKNLTTKRYDIADLIRITAEGSMTALPYRNDFGNGNVNRVMADGYGLNGGKPLSSINRFEEYFSLQQGDEVEVYNAVSVTRVSGKPVPQNWYTYDKADPNSIALLMGADSGGQLRVTVSNTGAEPANAVSVIVPIAHKGVDLGNVFMDGASEFSMQLSPDAASMLANDFTATYIRLDKAYDTLDALHSDLAGFGEVLPAEANAILLTCPGLAARADAELLFDVDVTAGEAGDENIWKNAFFYKDSSLSVQYQKNGDYVAVGVAGSTITGYVFEDANANGVLDSGEAGVSGIRVMLVDVFGRVESAVTDPQGYYEFVTVRDGTVSMTFTVTDTTSPLRLNIAGGDVTPGAKGLTATAGVTALSSAYTINAPMGSFHTLRYDVNGGAANTAPPPAEYWPNAVAAAGKKPDNMTRTGYRFTGWNTQGDGSGDTYLPGENLVITADTTLYAQWEICAYYITYNYRGATGENGVPGKFLTHNTTYGTGGNLPLPTRTGYNFTRWSRNAQGTQAVTNTSIFNLGADTTLYAIWAEKSFSVEYDYNDGVTGNSSASKTWTAKVLPAADPTRTGYAFAGWTYNGVRVDSGDTYAGLAVGELPSITLTAQWTAKTGYTVKYNCNGGSSTAAPTATVAWDEGVVPGTNPTFSGHAFDGWRLGADTGPPVTSADTYGGLAGSDSTMEITLVAAWKATIYLVRYDSAGGTPVNDESLANTSDRVPASAMPTRPGYIFDGWYTQPSGGTAVADDSETYDSLAGSAAALTLYARWTPKLYTIVYEGTGGATVGGNPPVERQEGVRWEDAVNPQTLAKFGYTFDGWRCGATTLAAGTATSVESLSPLDDAGDTLTLSALLRENRYTVVFYSQNRPHDTKTGVPFTAPYAAMLPTQPSRVGYTFQGWRHGGSYTLNDANTLAKLLQDKIKDDVGTVIRLDAVWAPKTGYQILFNTNGGTAVSPRTGVSWSDAVLPVESTSRTGFTLRHWSFSGAQVSAGATYGSLAPGDVPAITLYARWDENSDYTVRYDMNGATSGAIADKTNVRWTGAGLLPSAAPERTGYTFAGWNVTQNGSGTDIQDSASYGVLAANDSASSITLQAQWAPKTGYSVLFDENGAASGAIPARTNLSWIDTDLLPPAPTKDGYVFEKWVLQNTLTEVTAATSYGMLAADDTQMQITLVAQWASSTYTVLFVDWDGQVLKTETVAHGGTATPPGAPSRHGHTFTGWDSSYTNVNADVVVTAQYSKNTAPGPAPDASDTVPGNGGGVGPGPPDTVPDAGGGAGSSASNAVPDDGGDAGVSVPNVVPDTGGDLGDSASDVVPGDSSDLGPSAPDVIPDSGEGQNALDALSGGSAESNASDVVLGEGAGSLSSAGSLPSERTEAPKTGDGGDLVFWIVLGALSLACLCGERLRRRAGTGTG